jgi:hypothetical protein
MSFLGTPFLDTPILGTPILGTPILGTPFLDTGNLQMSIHTSKQGNTEYPIPKSDTVA